MTLALQVKDLRKAFRAPDGSVQPVVDVARLELAPGEQVALRGGSGSGKTTLLHLIAGILVPDSGEVRVAGRHMSAADEALRDRARAEVLGYVFQSFHLLQGLSALENVALAMHLGRGTDLGRARELLGRVGLSDRLDYRPRQLSIGQQQRVAVARALAGHPALVLADEPTGNLDRARADEALALIRDICREESAALLLVSHDERALAGFERVIDLALLNRCSQGGAVAREERLP
ncbi:MAG: ABC transporter ATP-binding protein [Planctomycetes bacterium]|nr:ABC transporter ATP-binding protein [Planctomycetota bacterium]